MQRITNCIVKKDRQVLLLQKPSRGWWVAPGGKMESGESIKEAVTREYREETGLEIQNPEIKGVFTIVIKDGAKVLNEWMMFTFLATEISGEMLAVSPEGKLKWQQQEDVKNLPMAPGDVFIFNHILHSNETIYGTFYYTEDFELLSYQLDPVRK
ncbi:8-oxo-dGTP diphosphatase [Anaerobacillus isosaccharinicus]|uniref:8-oxo-dGTP diphosphatase n=1 Tax=Anaerobacillus isosaccharinicus TaxID=1532552 RepID=A0A1S2MFF6_9BACI|nr:8-oxo-dGTP diphosphatase [Anaerobacillus isosaccharinicus]MBA5584677.1 8-oxo-dGTP diphosphatase [Anaerobacillus isosaccharinicus]QOY36951.1 8-oxo-dGTP diphosphatase [Anaerobacillus isosaccharinicus]